jgi:adenylate kinase family enzyme
MEHVRMEDCFRDEITAKTEVGSELLHFYQNRQRPSDRPPTSIFLPMLQAIIERIDAEGKKGWLLERGPRTTGHFQDYKAAGICPNKVVVLDVDTEVILRRTNGDRTKGRRVDPVTQVVYNTEGNMPIDPKVLARLVKRDDGVGSGNVVKRIRRFKDHALPVLAMCPRNMVRNFPTDRPPAQIAAAVNAFFGE